MKRLILLVSCVCAALLSFGEMEGKFIKGWRGDELSAFLGSTTMVKDLRLDHGILKGHATGRDAQLWTNISPALPTHGCQVVYIKMKCDVGGSGDIFWKRTQDESCSEERKASFPVKKDGDWHTYRARPNWNGEIKCLRIDLPTVDGGFDFAIAAVVIREEGGMEPFDASDYLGVVFDLQMPPGLHYCTFTWGGTDPGQSSFETATDGRPHTYFLDLKNVRGVNLKGTVNFAVAEQRRKSQDLPARNMHFVKKMPAIPGSLDFSGVGSLEAIPRAGRPFTIEAVVRNFGTCPASNVTFKVEGLPSGARLLNPADLKPSKPQPGNDGRESVGKGGRDMTPQLKGERLYRLHLSDLGEGTHTLKVTMSADGTEPITRELKVKVLPSLKLPKATYVPEPKPISTAPYEVGAILFPGWDKHGWQAPWSHALWRKPVLGWYDETNPETIDWQIKQLVEHGISFVSVDWYWCKGDHSHAHWADSAFKKAKYRKYLKWAVHWCNHNREGTHSFADQEKVTQFWIDNYFKDPQYHYIDGKPVVYIWTPFNMERDMKAQGGCKAMLECSQRVAKAAGYKGIYFIAYRGMDREDPAFLKQFQDWGFDETCVYRYMGGIKGLPLDDEGNSPYKWVADTSLGHWRRLLQNTTVPFMPSLSTSWDNRPWLAEIGFARTGYNVADFKRICEDAKTFVDESKGAVKRILMGPLDEWGEGEIGYPNAEFGFGMLDAVRDTFGHKPPEGWPLDIAPEDVGLTCPQLTDGSNP